uniref:Uncharacterized protein n=1 Tax=Arundo donax TaxID=35708 RepID=A0A0A8Y3A9_ARUDO
MYTVHRLKSSAPQSKVLNERYLSID